MTGLGTPAETTPARRGSVTELIFATRLGIPEIRVYEPAVGATCRFVRTSEDGGRQECGGAVNRVEPYVHVTLNGEGWR